MDGDFHKISFQLGEITGQLKEINSNTSEIRAEVKSVSKRVTTLENTEQFEKGVTSQNKKIAGVAGSVSGMVGGGFIAWLVKVLSQ